MRTFGAKNRLFDHFLTPFLMIFDHFYPKKWPRWGRYGAMTALKGPQRAWTLKIKILINFWWKTSKNHQKMMKKWLFDQKFKISRGTPGESEKSTFSYSFWPRYFSGFFVFCTDRGRFLTFLAKIIKNGIFHQKWQFSLKINDFCHNPLSSQ